MRHYILLALILLSISTLVSAQTAAVASSDADKLRAKQTEQAVFTREKFDPARDAASDLAAAMDRAKSSGKRIILDVGGEWCGWCVYMDKFFYLNPAITKLRDDNFVWIKVNFSEENENRAFLRQFPAPTGYPYLYVLDETGKLLKPLRTASLESGNTYDQKRFKQFLSEWAPKKASTEARENGDSK